MSAGHVCLSLTFSRELVLEPQLDQEKISASDFLHCWAQSESKRTISLEFGYMTSKGTHQLEVKKNPTAAKYFRALSYIPY